MTIRKVKNYISVSEKKTIVGVYQKRKEILGMSLSEQKIYAKINGMSKVTAKNKWYVKTDCQKETVDNIINMLFGMTECQI